MEHTSANGTASQTPSTPHISGNIDKNKNMNKNVLKNDMSADTFPFDKAVNIAEEKILKPHNKKEYMKIRSPLYVIL